MLPCWRRNPAVATYSFGTLPHDQAQLGHLPPTLRREDTDKGTGGGGPCIPSPRLGTDALPIFVTPLLTVCWHAEHNATGLRPMSAMPPAAHARNMGHDARAGRPRLDRKSRSRQGSPRATPMHWYLRACEDIFRTTRERPISAESRGCAQRNEPAWLLHGDGLTAVGLSLSTGAKLGMVP